MQLVFLKLIVAIIVVLLLSTIAERVSPRVAGILSGAPTGTPISLFFFGLELGPAFAAHSAVYNVAGLVAMLSFITAYYCASVYWGVTRSSLAAVSVYFGVIAVVRMLPLQMWSAVVIAICAIVVFATLLKKIPNTVITERAVLNPQVLLVRALCAASIILAVTMLAKVVGTTWSGLFSAFPTTLFPLMLIVHLTYGKERVHTVIKHVPFGAVSLVLYSLTVSLAYPALGIAYGTIAAFAVAIVYLVGYQYFLQSHRISV